ncbi:hypothetical protein [Rhizobium sp. Rhizsp42]|uniref:hypothetical protein n=1 Tax=Rhizobium sp. Rhizsp42 TaxID=3243034 RepID=UPI0039B0C5C5
MTPDQEALYRQALDEIKTISVAGSSPLDTSDLSDLLRQHGLVTASIDPRNNTITGYTAAGVAAVNSLAKTFRPALSHHSSRVSNVTLANVMRRDILQTWRERGASQPEKSDFDTFERAIAEWLGAFTQVRQHLVPCTIYPFAIPSFDVGPVTFRHFSELPTEGSGISREEFWPKAPPLWRQWCRDVWAAIRRRPVEREKIGGFQFSRFAQFATERAAPWVAFVKVTGRPPDESIRAADLLSDIALAAIQLVSPSKDMRAITRASARTSPAWRADMSWTEDAGFSPGVQNLTPALTRSPLMTDKHIREVGPSLRSMGNRLSAFLDGSSSVPDLEEAWCNAAYWYHEALAETLDTVAVAKLETAIEVLLRAASLSGSKRRLHESFEVFLGLTGADLIGTGKSLTVEQFIEAITTARSRVLHGTWPTIQFDLPANKSGQTISYEDVEELTRILLLEFSVWLDEYIATGSAIDGTEAFFSWIRSARLAAATSQAAP